MYETFAHTADVGLRIVAPDLDQLFAEAGEALFSLVVSDRTQVRGQQSQTFRIEGQDIDFLLVDWLNELLFCFDSRRMLFCEFHVTVDSTGLSATARGERFDERRHQLEHEIKAITYHGLKVEQVESNWTATVIVDI